MDLDIRYVNLPVSDALEKLARRRLARALRPFAGNVEHVEVRIEDINGPRGGVDKRCTATAKLRPTSRKIVVTHDSADAYDAVHGVCARLAESVGRALARRRWLDRFGPSARPRMRPARPAPTEPTPPEPGPPTARDGHIRVTVADHQRLRALVDSWPEARDGSSAQSLSDELDRAEIVPAERIADNVVTMNSRVVFRDEESGESREVSLVYPRESAPSLGRVSVLAPVGSALLGLSVGQTIDWPMPKGKLKRLRIEKVLYQPEQAGHLHL